MTTNLGRIGIVPKGDYSSATTYKLLDVVRYGTGSYMCKVATSNAVLPTDTTNWMLLNSDGATGTTGTTGSNGTNGTDGATWYFGSDTPSAGTGVNGDFYLNTTSWNVSNKVAGSWVNQGSIKGATGASGQVFSYVGDWLNKPASLTNNYTDRIFITDVGVGGSEWYWDGSRYRVVGGQVTIIALPAQAAITGASTADTTMLINSPTTTCKIPAGLIKTGDRLSVETYLSKPNTIATIGSSTSIRFRFGSTGSGTDPYITSSPSIQSTYRALSDTKTLIWQSDTSIRRIVDSSSPYGQSTTVDSLYNGASSILNNTNYLTVTAGLTGGSTPANDTLQLLSFTATLKTCG